MKLPIWRLIVRKLRQAIAIVEEGDTCTHSSGLAVGKYVIWKGTLCKVTTAMAYEETISGSKLEVVSDGIANEISSKLTNDVPGYISSPYASEVIRQSTIGSSSVTLTKTGWYKLLAQGDGVSINYGVNGESLLANNINQRQTTYIPLKVGTVLEVKCTNSSTWGAVFEFVTI